MNKDEIKEIVEVLQDFQQKKNAFKEKIGNMFYGAIGALITLLLVGQWNSMRETSNEAKSIANATRKEYTEAFSEKNKVDEATFRVYGQRISKLEVALNLQDAQIIGPAMPLNPSAITFDSVEQEQQKIEKEVDKEIYRSRERN